MKTTKTIYLMLLCFFFSITIYGADLFVYPNAQSPDYADIQSAIDAASDGDNIYIDTASYIGNININKTLSFYPLHKGGMFTINGAVTLNLINNRTIYIQGLNGGGVSSSFSGNYTDSASVILNGCEFSSPVTINDAYSIRSFIYYSTFNSSVDLDACELIGNTFNGMVNISANQNSSNIPPYIKVYANDFGNTTAQLYIQNAHQANIHIANNFFYYVTNNSYSIYVAGSSSSQKADKVIIENNIIKNSYTIYSSNYGDFDIVYSRNIDFLFIRNNYFDIASYNSNYNNIIGIYTSSIGIYDFQYNFTNYLDNLFSKGSGTIQTIANNTYGTTLSYNTTSQNSLGNVTSISGIDAGSQLPECRDINNTQNDIGTYGGPHSWSNYHNNSSSMAQILDLEIPYYQIVLPGTQIEFKSKAIHKNE
tara:strand:+ start:336 stop:1601 length:1266 start_codon:yes stop_codon:yes gene_type:complete